MADKFIRIDDAKCCICDREDVTLFNRVNTLDAGYGVDLPVLKSFFGVTDVSGTILEVLSPNIVFKIDDLGTTLDNIFTFEKGRFITVNDTIGTVTELLTYLMKVTTADVNIELVEVLVPHMSLRIDEFGTGIENVYLSLYFFSDLGIFVLFDTIEAVLTVDDEITGEVILE